VSAKTLYKLVIPWRAILIVVLGLGFNHVIIILHRICRDIITCLQDIGYKVVLNAIYEML
ncbi:MAG TPA: hypothetical protein PLA17_11135, partial [Bacteroidales bacterium]|nr:hypothetical protein [Bacteroidales bacterium]